MKYSQIRNLYRRVITAIYSRNDEQVDAAMHELSSNRAGSTVSRIIYRKQRRRRVAQTAIKEN